MTLVLVAGRGVGRGTGSESGSVPAAANDTGGVRQHNMHGGEQRMVSTLERPAIKVRQLELAREAVWRFGDTNPTWQHRGRTAGAFDPWPCYTHHMGVVHETAGEVARACPPIWDVDLVVADLEEVTRTNGHSYLYESGHWDDDEKWVTDPRVGLILLSGKRTPPHPAVTRYLVAHEYGHNIEYMINVARGGRHGHCDQLVDEYARLRGLPLPIHHGSGGRWHDSPVEVLACDFRIIVCGVEVDYWPHPGIAHPHDLNVDLTGWWEEAKSLLAGWVQSAE